MVLSMNRWVGKVAVVTGASAGIGATIADQLVEAGLIVVGLARRVEKIETRAKELNGKKGKLIGYKADMSVEDEIVKAFKWIHANVGPVAILINNAGVTNLNTLIGGDTAKWRNVLDINVIGLCIATREAIAQMKKAKINGHVIHINSIVGHKVVPNSHMYSASKFAVTALTETLRQELVREQSKIKITSISPGVVISIMTSQSGVAERLVDVPKLQTEDIADGVQYVLSTPEHVQVHELTIKPIGELF